MAPNTSTQRARSVRSTETSSTPSRPSGRRRDTATTLQPGSRAKCRAVAKPTSPDAPATRTVRAMDGPVYRAAMRYQDMDRATLDAAYNNVNAVGQAKRDAYIAEWSARSDAVRRARRGHLDLRYGAGARQRLDVFPCGTPGAPTLAWIHGGYW